MHNQRITQEIRSPRRRWGLVSITDKTLKEKLGIVEIADVEALFDALMPWEKKEFINGHIDLAGEVGSGNSDILEDDYSMEDVIESAEEAVDVFGEEEILENVSNVTIANYVLEHKQVLKRIFARIVKEDRIK